MREKSARLKYDNCLPTNQKQCLYTKCIWFYNFHIVAVFRLQTKTYEESNLFKTFINNNIKKSLICLPLVIDLALHQNVESLTFVCPIS